MNLSEELSRLLVGFRAGDRSALAKTISLVDDQMPGSSEFLEAVLREPKPPGARVGITGPPGSGKSTIASGLAVRLRDRSFTVGVLAIDPTSPLSGGALLGDRVRIGELATDSGVFFRSMASRGALGGLGGAAADVLELMDAFGFDWLVVESVGAGQVETEISNAADTVVVVVVPESGDGIQTLKAGMLEVGDLLVVNKADREGAELVAADLREMLTLRGQSGRLEDAASSAGGWSPPVILTEARSGEGIDTVFKEIVRHRDHLEASGELGRRRRSRVAARVRELVNRGMRDYVEDLIGPRGLDGEKVDRVVTGGATAHDIAQELLHQLRFGDGGPDAA